jgi:drug/metabolite transporter (DMT)-like permease
VAAHTVNAVFVEFVGVWFMQDAPRALSFRETIGDALRYWEPRRLVYNGALFALVAGCFVIGWPVSKRVIGMEPGLTIFILAVLANVAYCAACFPDLIIQQSALREVWLRWRWVLFVIGTLFASAIAYFCVAGMFGLGSQEANG